MTPYEELQRIETWPMPMPALRKAVLNAEVNGRMPVKTPVETPAKTLLTGRIRLI